MAYIGQGIKQGTFKVLDTSGNTYNGSNTTFSLGTQVGAAAQLLVSHDGVIQKPGTDYTLASGGASITFSTAPASGASIFITEISGAVGGTVTPSDTSVTADKLNTALLTGHTDIGADIADADLFLVDDGAGGTLRKTAASRLKTYAGFGVSDITGATELAAEPADTDEFVLSDAGTLKRIDYSHIRAGWQLLSTTDVSDGTSTVQITLAGSYALYAVTFTNLIPNNDNNTLRHAFSDDDFSSVNQQIYGGFAIHGVTKSAFYTNDNFQQATGYVRIADTVGGNNTYEGVRGIIYYANMRTAAPKGMYWGNVMGYDASEKAANHTLTGWMDSTNACTGIAYNYDSGTFKSGQIKLYGLK